jgi:hypothetical protein
MTLVLLYTIRLVSCGPTFLHAHHSGSTSSAGASNHQVGSFTSSNTAPTVRASSFAQSNAGWDDGWDDTDCGDQCVYYFCFGPRTNRERFRPWRGKSRAGIEAEEPAKKEKTTKNAPWHRKSKAPKTQNAVRPPHHLDPQRDHIQAAIPATHDIDDTTCEPQGRSGEGAAGEGDGGVTIYCSRLS